MKLLSLSLLVLLGGAVGCRQDGINYDEKRANCLEHIANSEAPLYARKMWAHGCKEIWEKPR